MSRSVLARSGTRTTLYGFLKSKNIFYYLTSEFQAKMLVAHKVQYYSAT